MKKLYITVLLGLFGAACDESQSAGLLTEAGAPSAEAGASMATGDAPGTLPDASRAMNVSGTGGASPDGGTATGGAGTGGTATGGAGGSDAGMATTPDASKDGGAMMAPDSGGGPNSVSVFVFTGATLTKEQLDAYEVAMRNGCGAPTRENKPCEIISPAPPPKLLSGRCHAMHCCVGCWDGNVCHVSADQGIWSQASAKSTACGSHGNDCSMCSATQACKQDPVNPSIYFSCQTR